MSNDANANASGGQEGSNGDSAGQGGNGNADPNANANANNGNEGGEGGDDKNGEGTKTPETVPYGRFSEQNAALKKAQAELAKRDADAEAARQAKLKEDGEFQKLLDEQAPKVERATKLESVVQKSVDALLEKIPEDRQKLIPESLSVEDKLEYIHTNLDFLTQTEEGKTVNRGGNPGSQTTSTKTFTAEQIADPAFYRENRDEIRLAQKEGRIKD